MGQSKQDDFEEQFTADMTDQVDEDEAWRDAAVLIGIRVIATLMRMTGPEIREAKRKLELATV